MWGNGWWHERGEDVAAIAVLVLVLAIAIAIALTSIQDLSLPGPEPPAPSVMLLSLLGLAANLATAYLFADPARQRWSFRLFAWRWVDPGLSLTIAVWLGASGRAACSLAAPPRGGAWTQND